MASPTTHNFFYQEVIARRVPQNYEKLLAATIMEVHQKVQINVISTETIKPDSPTPSHLTNLTLSFLDQKSHPDIVPTILFYPAPVGVAPLDIARLKTCLSQTLSVFYPLAGRYETWGTTLCNDEGVPFVVARVNCPISAVISSLTSSSSSKIDLIGFYPPKELLMTVPGIHLAIQINVFTCGGFALGWYHTHKVTDAVSAATFLKHWAALVSERYEDAAQTLPDFNAGPIAFPPIPEEDRPLTWSDFKLGHERTILRSFVFNSAAVAQLKAASASEKVANPTRFLAVAAFVWQHIMLASPPNKEDKKPVMIIPVNLRSRCDPVLPSGSMGNIGEVALARADKQAPLPELVAEIHESISKMKHTAAEYQGEKRAEVKEKQWLSFVNTVMEYEGKDVYLLSAWCKSAGFGDVDFGFGKPDWIIPIDDVFGSGKTNLFYLTDFKDSDGDGFEAWLFLNEHSAKFLASSSDFLARASPRFT